jgi:hypothetical protein
MEYHGFIMIPIDSLFAKSHFEGHVHNFVLIFLFFFVKKKKGLNRRIAREVSVDFLLCGPSQIF